MYGFYHFHRPDLKFKKISFSLLTNITTCSRCFGKANSHNKRDMYSWIEYPYRWYFTGPNTQLNNLGGPPILFWTWFWVAHIPKKPNKLLKSLLIDSKLLVNFIFSLAKKYSTLTLFYMFMLFKYFRSFLVV